MLNTRQVAEKLRTPIGTVYRYIYSRILPAHKLGGNGKSRRHWHIREADLEAFINGRQAVEVEPAHKGTSKISSSELVAGSIPTNKKEKNNG